MRPGRAAAHDRAGVGSDRLDLVHRRGREHRSVRVRRVQGRHRGSDPYLGAGGCALRHPGQLRVAGRHRDADVQRRARQGARFHARPHPAEAVRRPGRDRQHASLPGQRRVELRDRPELRGRRRCPDRHLIDHHNQRTKKEERTSRHDAVLTS